MEKIRAASRYFWPGFCFESSIFVAALRLVYDVTIVDQPERADLIFESHWPLMTFAARAERKLKRWRGIRADGKRIFYSGEAWSLPVGHFHGVISTDLHLRDNHFRLPFWITYCDLWGETGGRQKPEPDAGFLPEQLTTARLTNPDKFACAIFSNPQHLRFKAAHWLGKFGKVDTFGKSVGRPIHSKMAVMPEYRFNLCFENSILPGYTTEKALQAKVAGCIPLYWGDPAYRVDFNAKSLINLYEYDCDFQRIFDTIDFEEIRHTPLMNQAPMHLLPDLARFLQGVMLAPATAVF